METTGSHQISIRLATDADNPTLLRLAALDSAPVPHGPVLVADLDGEIVAARSIERERRSIADPFRPTAEARELLELRARQAACPERPPRNFPRRRHLPRSLTAAGGAPRNQG